MNIHNNRSPECAPLQPTEEGDELRTPVRGTGNTEDCVEGVILQEDAWIVAAVNSFFFPCIYHYCGTSSGKSSTNL